MSGVKRAASVPREARLLAHRVSKSDLLEVAWSLAALANDAGSVDDDVSTLSRLVDELNAQRENRGLRPSVSVRKR
jgi:hypothetical protein